MEEQFHVLALFYAYATPDFAGRSLTVSFRSKVSIDRTDTIIRRRLGDRSYAVRSVEPAGDRHIGNLPVLLQPFRPYFP
jgi:hypothetical protein